MCNFIFKNYPETYCFWTIKYFFLQYLDHSSERLSYILTGTDKECHGIVTRLSPSECSGWKTQGECQVLIRTVILGKQTQWCLTLNKVRFSSKMVSFVCGLVCKTILHVNEAQIIIARATSFMQLQKSHKSPIVCCLMISNANFALDNFGFHLYHGAHNQVFISMKVKVSNGENNSLCKKVKEIVIFRMRWSDSLKRWSKAMRQIPVK